jgi:hypothetical protein
MLYCDPAGVIGAIEERAFPSAIGIFVNCLLRPPVMPIIVKDQPPVR